MSSGNFEVMWLHFARVPYLVKQVSDLFLSGSLGSGLCSKSSASSTLLHCCLYCMTCEWESTTKSSTQSLSREALFPILNNLELKLYRGMPCLQTLHLYVTIVPILA
ncbi:hypothetical protein ACFE04_017121 [Oxalis oulophora]